MNQLDGMNYGLVVTDGSGEEVHHCLYPEIPRAEDIDGGTEL